jgi:hypothetical protein
MIILYPKVANGEVDLTGIRLLLESQLHTYVHMIRWTMDSRVIHEIACLFSIGLALPASGVSEINKPSGDYRGLSYNARSSL